MTNDHPLAKTNDLLHKAAEIAKTKGLDIEFTFQDIGDLYHVYGVNATASKFVAMMKWRSQHRHEHPTP